MPDFHINMPIQVTLDVEVDAEMFRQRAARLLSHHWQSESGSLHPAAENFLVATKRFAREAAAWILASNKDNVDYSSARDAIPEETIRISINEKH
jgi:hypothetical protein